MVLVEPKYSGNVGAVARVMMNFDFEKLILVNPCKLDEECYTRAMHAQRVLDNAEIFPSFEDAVKNLDHLAATSSIESSNEKRHLRNSLLVNEFADKINEVNGKVGLIFGREDYGLYNEEISQCDTLIRIPTSEKYLSLNLSHAVSLVLYTLFVKNTFKPKKRRDMGRVERDKLYEFFSILLDEVNYPEHKKENTKIMFQRMTGRAIPSKWEYHTLMGVFSKTIEKLKKR